MTYGGGQGGYLTPQQASRVYDRIGRFQNWQSIYESAAIRELVRAAAFDSARSIFEFGCGTGAFAATLLKGCVPSTCRYTGIDISPKMIQLASSRLEAWADRIQIRLSNGSPELHEPGGAFDRFVSNYVFDLLAPAYADAVISEAHRILAIDGKLCLVSLARAGSGLPATLTALWERVWQWKPELVGGCRPVDLISLLRPQQWSIEYQAKIVSFGVPSAIVIASRRAP